MKNYRQNKEQMGIFGKQTFLKKKIPKAVRKKFRQKRGEPQLYQNKKRRQSKSSLFRCFERPESNCNTIEEYCS